MRIILGLCFLVFTSNWAHAELSIEITGGAESATPIAIVPFGGASPTDISSVVNDDLGHSGYFKTLAQQGMPGRPTTESEVDYGIWKNAGQEYLVVGQVNQEGGRYNVQFELFTVFKGERMLAYRMTVAGNELRRTAHHISDLIFEKITGKKGVFGTHIAYVTSVGGNGKKKLSFTSG